MHESKNRLWSNIANVLLAKAAHSNEALTSRCVFMAHKTPSLLSLHFAVKKKVIEEEERWLRR